MHLHVSWSLWWSLVKEWLVWVYFGLMFCGVFLLLTPSLPPALQAIKLLATYDTNESSKENVLATIQVRIINDHWITAFCESRC